MSRADMRHDLAPWWAEMPLREKVGTYFRFYCRATRWWDRSRLVHWWNERRYGPAPALLDDPVYQRLFGDGGDGHE